MIDLSSVVEEVNDKHLAPWAKACRNDGIDNTPLSPYMSEELLYNKNLYLDGRKLKSCGFTVSIPKLTKDNLSQVSTETLCYKPVLYLTLAIIFLSKNSFFEVIFCWLELSEILVIIIIVIIIMCLVYVVLRNYLFI